MQTIKVRQLTRGDRKRLSRMIMQAAERFGDSELLTMIRGSETAAAEKTESQPDQLLQIGITTIRHLFEIFEDDMTEWFADLIDVPVEEFDNLPIDIEVQILNQIADREEFGRFFSGASQLSKKISGFRSMFSSGKTPSDSTGD